MAKKSIIGRDNDGNRTEHIVEYTPALIQIHKTIEDANTALIGWINDFAKNITGDIPRDEQLSWSLKEPAAIAILASTATVQQTELIADEAAITGETNAELAAAIIAKATVYRRVVSRMAGLRRGTQAALVAADINSNPSAYDDILAAAKTQALAMATALGISI